MAKQNADEIIQEALHQKEIGNSRRAYELLKSVTVTEPDNLKAWVWLGTIAPNIDEQIAALEKANRLRPGVEQVEKRLNQLFTKRREAEQDHKLRLDELYSDALAMVKDDVITARMMLMQIVEEDETRVEAWFELAQIMDSPDDQLVALENVLALNPNHRKAKEKIKPLKTMAKNPIAAAEFYEKRGEIERATLAYEHLVDDSKTAKKTRKAAEDALKRIRASGMAAGNPNLVLPTRKLIVNSLLSMAIYIGMAAVLGGFNLAAVPPLVWVGVPVVFFGALLMVLAGDALLNPLWTTLFGPMGLVNSVMQQPLWFIGVCLVVVPMVVVFGMIAIEFVSNM